MEKFAVIDLGSNTFHLLIAQLDANFQLSIVYKNRVYARLARTGIGVISDKSFQYGLKILRGFKETIDQHEVQEIKIIGTEMLRLAPNGVDFVQQAFRQTGLKVEIISGLQEAEYIYLGVKQLYPNTSYLIMDIGGGSVEFILVKNGQQIWVTSIPIGIAVLYFRFHLSDPISQRHLGDLRQFLAEKMIHLAQAIKDNPVDDLIGASGVFATFFDLLEVSSDKALDTHIIKKRLKKLTTSSYDERLEMENIPEMRKKMIIVASVLLEFVLELTSVKRIHYSPNSLKEGLLYTMIQEKKL